MEIPRFLTVGYATSLVLSCKGGGLLSDLHVCNLMRWALFCMFPGWVGSFGKPIGAFLIQSESGDTPIADAGFYAR